MKRIRKSIILALVGLFSIVTLYAQDTPRLVEEEYSDGFRYFGYKLNGQYNGNGKGYYPDGTYYEGEWKSGNRHGQGVVYYPSGKVRYRGYFDGNKFSKGVLYAEDGQVIYNGSWQNDLYHGQGVAYFLDGSHYKGEFKEGKYDGKGVLYLGNVKVYDGEWKEGVYNGQGTLYQSNGEKYVGMFVDGLQNGRGVLYDSKGKVLYDGSWVDGLRHGKGNSHYNNGKIIGYEVWEKGEYSHLEAIIDYRADGYDGTYKGVLVDDMPNGKGEFYLADGTLKYSGEWKDGLYHGKGVLHYLTGEINYDGEWANGQRHGKGLVYYSDGKVSECVFVEGRQILAVPREPESIIEDDFDDLDDFEFQYIQLEDIGVVEEEVKEDPVFVKVERMPSFKGGDLNTFRQWFGDEFKYPTIAAENGIQGRMVVKFVIEKDGSLTNIEFLQSPDPVFNEEVIRVLKKSPKWTPGYQQDRPVRVNYILPIEIRLTDEGTSVFDKFVRIIKDIFN